MKTFLYLLLFIFWIVYLTLYCVGIICPSKLMIILFITGMGLDALKNTIVSLSEHI